MSRGSKTAQWRERKQRPPVCCEWHNEAFIENGACNCEFHADNNTVCCEYHSSVDQHMSEAESSQSESSDCSLEVPASNIDTTLPGDSEKSGSIASQICYLHDGNVVTEELASVEQHANQTNHGEGSGDVEHPGNLSYFLPSASPQRTSFMSEDEQLCHQFKTNDCGDCTTSGVAEHPSGPLCFWPSASPHNTSFLSEDEQLCYQSGDFQMHAFGENEAADGDSEHENSEHSVPGSDDYSGPGDGDSENDSRGLPSPPGNDPDDPDDPDDPEDPGEEENEDSDSESDPDADMQVGATNFSLEKEKLDFVLDIGAGRTTREVLAMVMALAVRSNLDYETVVKVLNILHVTMARSNLPTTKDQLWSALNRNAAGIRKNVYCARCFKLLGLFEQMPNPVICACGWTRPKRSVKYFITLNVRNQLESILRRPGMWEKLQYPQNRQKRSAEGKEDILDGDAYIELREALGLTAYDFTYVFNMDGLKVFKSGKTQAWPIFVRINELPPNLRQKNVILAGVWLDQEHVDFNLFMKYFLKQANKLSDTGVVWMPDGINHQTSRFFPTCCSADSKARAEILSMADSSGSYGCTFCEHQGIKLEGSMKYPIPGTRVHRIRVHEGVEYVEEVEIQPAPLRTDQSIKTLMQQVAEDPHMHRIRGVIGPARVMLMSHFDLGIGFSTDDLHPLYLGVARFHTELLLEGIENVYRVGKNGRAIITRRLLKSLTRTHISRKPRSIDLIALWKASEWRNWLLFYAIPCLQGVVPERYLRVFALLSKAVFLLTRDVIEEEDFVEAARCLDDYLVQFQEIYGPQNMRFNVHILTHIIQSARSWGPLFSHGTMPFESWNHRIAMTVSSPKGAIDQVVMRYLMHTLVYNIEENPDISEEVKEVIEKKILKSKFEDVRNVDGAYFFGRSIERNATEREMLVLTDLGYQGLRLTVYYQVKVNGVECRSLGYNGELMSNNTFFYSYDDDFGVVVNIVVLEGDNPVAGVFVQLYQTGAPLLGVSHIVPVLNDNDGLYFFRISDIRNLAVKMNVLDKWYISPMANQQEID